MLRLLCWFFAASVILTVALFLSFLASILLKYPDQSFLVIATIAVGVASVWSGDKFWRWLA